MDDEAAEVGAVDRPDDEDDEAVEVVSLDAMEEKLET